MGMLLRRHNIAEVVKKPSVQETVSEVKTIVDDEPKNIIEKVKSKRTKKNDVK